MHSISSRINVVFSVGLSALGLCAGLMAATTYANEVYFSPATPTGSVTPTTSHVVKIMLPHPQNPSIRKPIERALVYFDVQADFTSCFNWNTKQLFVWVVAEYTSKDFKRNEVTLWDHIVTSKDDAIIDNKKAIDYFFDDIKENLSGTTVTARLKYQIMSHSGFTHMREVTSAASVFKL